MNPNESVSESTPESTPESASPEPVSPAESVSPDREPEETGVTIRAAVRSMIGRVVSDKMQKTVTVVVERRVKHPLYKKYIRRSTRIHAHDEADECKVGDFVSIVQCRPLSKTKAWRVHEIIARAK